MGSPIEYGGAWVHWHQPHTWSEISRAGLEVALSDDPARASWYVGDDRREAGAERDAIARRGWDQFVDGVEGPCHYPMIRSTASTCWRALTASASHSGSSSSSSTRRSETCSPPSSSRSPTPRLTEAGSVAVLRWHALSGYSLALTQFTGSRVTLVRGTGALIDAIARRPRLSSV